MDLPISRFLKRREEIAIALLEDEVVANKVQRRYRKLYSREKG